MIGLLAIGAKAPVIERAEKKPVSVGANVYALGTNLDASPATCTGRRAIYRELAQFVAIARRRRTNDAIDLGEVGPFGKLVGCLGMVGDRRCHVGQWVG